MRSRVTWVREPGTGGLPSKECDDLIRRHFPTAPERSNVIFNRNKCYKTTNNAPKQEEEEENKGAA